MKREKTITLVMKETVTDEEISLVKMIANNMRAKDIAEKTGETTAAIESRLHTLKRKYKTPTPAGLVMLFSRNNLIQ